MSPLVCIAIFFTLGLGLGLIAPVPPVWAISAGGLITLTVIIAMTTRKQIRLSLISAVLIAGWIRPAEPGIDPVPDPLPPCTRVVEGTVAEPPMRLGEYDRTAIEISRWSECLTQAAIRKLTDAHGRLVVLTPRGFDNLPERGEMIRIRARIRAIVPSRNFGLPRRHFDGPMYSAFVSPRDALATVKTSASSLRQSFDKWRWNTADSINSALPEEEASYARALLLGQSRALDFGQMNRFRRTGTAHLISVSGLHLGLVTLFIFLAAKAFFTRTPLAHRMDVGRLAALIAIPAAISFALLTGCRTPVVRASVMAVSTLLARCIGRENGAVEALALSAIAILAANPEDLLNPGFQLSFAAVLGFFFAFSSKPDDESGRSVDSPGQSVGRRVAKRIATALGRLALSSTAACSVTTPLVLYHFGYVSLVAIPANMFAVPLTACVILPLLLIILATSSVSSGIATLFYIPAGYLLRFQDALLAWISSTSCTIENPGPLTAAGVVLVSMGLLLVVARIIRPGIALLVLGIAFWSAGSLGDPPKIPPGKLTVTLLDVGQGDSILVSFPNGRHLLMDAGGTRTGRFDVGERLVVPALRALDIKRLDRVVLSHPDFDHAGGMAAVFDTFEIGEFWENGQVHKDPLNAPLENLRAIAHRKKIPIRRTPDLCRTHQFGEAAATVIHPCSFSEGFDPSGSVNSNSLVLVLTFGRTRVALTGDIDHTVEQRLVAAGRIPPVDILKLPHHGSASASSDAFLNALSPGIAVVSLGRFNPHGMPHASVRRRLMQKGIPLLRTDLLGAIRLTIDRRGIGISSAR